uniref:RNase H type-1 domain-containing protein n=1 Tax=Aegilops tauschii subsp. strangulata TaxID=200361 RepID=A0A453HF87_AEGTS
LMNSLSLALFVKLAVTLWAIWAARRKAIHEGIFQSAQTIHGFINRYIDELNMLAEPTHTLNQRTGSPTVTSQRPKAPPAGYSKIHVDAACRKGAGGTAAAVCRDANGLYLGSSVLVIGGVDDLASLETIACREALALAQDLNLNHIGIASDSKGVVGAINMGARGENGAIISEINSLASSFTCNFSFEGRAANTEAHNLAKFALSLGLGRHVWLGKPHDVRRIPLSVDFAE